MPTGPGPFQTGDPARGDASAAPPAPLIRLHRHSLTNVMVIGGTAARRNEVARSFHRESPLRGAAFVAVDAASEGEKLHQALDAWAGASAATEHPLVGAEHGTLFIDHVDRLSTDDQALLLTLGRRLLGEPGAKSEVACPGRVVVGNPRPLARAVEEGRFLETLYDALDKVRVELEVPPSGEGD
jgi:DNA-binding NtrC family response regulator